MKNDQYIELDDIAYELYYNERKDFVIVSSMGFFINHKNDYKKYYNQAKRKLRKEKLEKLNEKRR